VDVIRTVTLIMIIHNKILSHVAKERQKAKQSVGALQNVDIQEIISYALVNTIIWPIIIRYLKG
jgi:hypothetical protein